MILEGLAGHDMAPVAGGVADGEENWPVLSGGGPEGFLTPGIPVHWIVCMLQEVGALLGDEAIGRSVERGATFALIGIYGHKDHN